MNLRTAQQNSEREITVTMIRKVLVFSLAPLTLAACVPAVMTPTVMVMPSPGKPPEIFAAEAQSCRQVAEQQIAAARANLNSQIVGAALLTNASDPLSSGQAVAQAGTPVLQQQYDAAYAQCMFAQGNRVPGMMAGPVVPDRPVRRRVRRHVAPKATPASAAGFVEPAPNAPPAPAPAPAPQPIVEPPPASH